MTDQELNQSYYRALDQLNPQQRKAVDQIEGPVLVVAGPGTGKTQILAARIGKILLETDTAHESILCLTFTEAGTIAMRKRLIDFIGPDAHRIPIHTFHSFCNKVIQENKDHFRVTDLEPISELEKIRLLQKLIDTFPNDHPLKRLHGNIYYETGRLAGLFKLMKTESWSAETIEGKAKEYLEELSQSEEMYYKRGNSRLGINKGDFKQKHFDDAVRKMDQLMAAAREFIPFQVMMEQAGRYDYDDMILWVVEAFRKSEWLLRRYQERFQYFLVDEYQDTNGAQNEVLKMLTSYWEKPDVFVVGDDDQSIFRFQGANVANIISFWELHQRFLEQDDRVVVLLDNYRSTQNILDASRALIEYNKERLLGKLQKLNLSKDLNAAGPLQGVSVSPELVVFPNPHQEVVATVRMIQSLQADNEKLEEVAVIYRAHKQADDLAAYLQAEGVPFNLKREVDILQEATTRKLMAILRYINGEITTAKAMQQSDQLFKILHYPFFKLKSLDIARLITRINALPWKEQPSLREALTGEEAYAHLFPSKEMREQCRLISLKLENWISKAGELTLPSLVELLISSSGLLTTILNDTNKVWLMEELHTFFEFVKAEASRQPGITLNEFITVVDTMSDYGIRLPLIKSIAPETGVNLLTAHASKGLEFDHVFIIGCTKNTWDHSRSSGTYSLPDTVSASNEGDNTEESRRLFYVAMTRARKGLTISYGLRNEEGKEQSPSRFFTELAEKAGLEPRYRELPEEVMTEYTGKMLEQPEPVVALPETAWLRELLDGYRMNVTHLNKFLKCPLSFYFDHILRLPAAKNRYMAYGSAIHGALEDLFRKMTKASGVFPPLEELLDDFNKAMYRQRDAFTEAEMDQMLERGIEHLKGFYSANVKEWHQNVLVEEDIRLAMLNEIPLRGKLDRIEIYEDHIVVADYKTGKPENAKRKLAAPGKAGRSQGAEFEQEFGGNYWRQAVFYKILVDNDPLRKGSMDFAVFEFVEPQNDGTFVKEKILVTPDDEQIVKSQIKDSYNKILNLEFDKGCGREDCEWCNFVRSEFEILERTFEPSEM